MRTRVWLLSFLAASLAALGLPGLGLQPTIADDLIPHAQDKPPGPPLSPEEAAKKMTVPKGFKVEVVAAEPDLVNPVAMTIDERGRFWVTESLEYPRLEPGAGRDRIKVLEDTDGDGKADKFTIFAEGLNIPSGIVVGYGGVWVANAPEILFMQDTDGDGKADKREVVVTGFGRDDTHELPNSLTWGPDGWLYGLNGVFNQTHVEQKGKRFDFTCALFRIHPRTREFQLFAEGTSNPWGVAWDGEGSAFLSACVIDHLWHLAESGYYIRQGGPYPPHTRPMRSIVNHKHQKAAYCGIHYFDSDAYPVEYRDQLYMGNIHGNCLNVDTVTRDGSTYFGKPKPDFLSANDAWFMPVVQKTGPDGCLYVLDWYDRYHCYQDARRDPEGIDRLKGRLYRVRYQETPRAAKFDLNKESDDQLIERLASPNVYFRDLAQRILSERGTAESRPKLTALVLSEQAPRKARLHALWTLVASGTLEVDVHQALLAHSDPTFRAWAIRAAGNFGTVDPAVRDKIVTLAIDPAPEVRLQVAIASKKLSGVDSLSLLLTVLNVSGDDKLIPHIVWQNLHPLLEDQSPRFLELVSKEPLKQSHAVAALMPPAIDRILANRHPAPIAALVKVLAAEATSDPAALERCFDTLTARLATREVSADQLAALRPELEELLQKILSGPPGDRLYAHAALLAATWKDPRALSAVRGFFIDAAQSPRQRTMALDTLIAANDSSLEQSIGELFSPARHTPVELRSAALASLSRLDAPWVATAILTNYQHLEPELRPRAIQLLTERRPWAEQLLDAIGRKEIAASVLNVNQVRQLLASGDTALADKVRAQWGALRTERDPKRDDVINHMRTFLRQTSGDAEAGRQVFQRVCGQCHKLHGEGQEVGPDITLNGRSSFEQLLSNVFDPSLVIGASYQARTVVTEDGRVLAGLVAEDSDQRVVLKVQGGKQETIPRGEIEAMKVSSLSLMPEDLEKQLKPQELADLFAYITLDKPPSDPAARRLPGSQPVVPRQAKDAAQFGELVREVAPGFNIERTGKSGIEIVAEHAGRAGVLRTLPRSRQEPTVLRGEWEIPADKRTRLVLQISHEAQGAWNLAVEANSQRLHRSLIKSKSGEPEWQTLSFDLTPLAGKKIVLQLYQGVEEKRPSAAYWGQIEVISD